MKPIESKYKSGDVVLHRNGTYYVIEGTPSQGYLIERTSEPAYVYTDLQFPCGRKWIRPQDEMEDGRFTPTCLKRTFYYD